MRMPGQARKCQKAGSFLQGVVRLELRSGKVFCPNNKTAMPRHQELAIADPAELCFGRCTKPLTTRRGLAIGGGMVYPELNFTLPTMFVDQTTMPEVRSEYRQIITGALQRAVELEAPGLIVEFETLPPMTENPAWGIELTRILLDAMEAAHAKNGLKSVLRITPNDTRGMVRPPRMRSGPLYDAMLATFEGCADAGAELLSIESVVSAGGLRLV